MLQFLNLKMTTIYDNFFCCPYVLVIIRITTQLCHFVCGLIWSNPFFVWLICDPACYFRKNIYYFMAYMIISELVVTWPGIEIATPAIRLHTLLLVTLYRTSTNGTEDHPLFYFYYFFISHVHLPILQNYVSISRGGCIVVAQLSNNQTVVRYSSLRFSLLNKHLNSETKFLYYFLFYFIIF